jgi:hypothetical protein
MDRTYLELNASSFQALSDLVARLSDEDLARAMEAGWTAAATLAHLAFWDRRAALLIKRWTQGGYAPSPYDHDAINDAMKPAWLLLPPRAAAEDALAAAAAADAAVAGAPDEVVAAIRKHGGVGLDRSHHRMNHLQEIAALFD